MVITPSTTIFADPLLDEQFRREGYVVLPFLNAEEVASLVRLHDQGPEPTSDFYATIFSPDSPERRRAADGIKAVIEPRIRELIPGYTTVSSNFIVKRAKTTQGRLPLHQDYSFVDQSLLTSVHLWCPLLDVDAHNGCMKVVPGSHSLVNHISAMIFNASPYDSVRPILEEDCTVSLPMKAGSALLLNERLLHGSEENMTPGVRLAMGAVFLPQDKKLRLYIEDESVPGKLDIVELRDEFAIQLSPGVRLPFPYPDGVTKIGSMEYAITPLTEEEIEPLRVRRTVKREVQTEVPREVPSLAEVTPVVARKQGFFSRLFGRP